MRGGEFLKGTELTPEMLEAAVEEAQNLYDATFMTPYSSGTKLPEDELEQWQKFADKFPPLSDKIIKLRRALDIAFILKNKYEDYDINEIRRSLGYIEDKVAKELLTDLLLGSLVVNEGNDKLLLLPKGWDIDWAIRSWMDIYVKSNAMIFELNKYLTDIRGKNEPYHQAVISVKPNEIFRAYFSGFNSFNWPSEAQPLDKK